ncbi:Serendipity locus protein H-1 [Cytospora mali]|uniref:Serendipity locus protein H-1 n=1 Tax=Cytospora mali TaxID=578113 RepID=A0A194V4X2_CYTMA|nr:Serendipity locus protein H-1 [Valsa mali var. pyri (nom. inval.)]
MARDISSGSIAGAAVGAAAAVILMLVCSLPFLLKCRRKRRLRKRQEQDALRPEMGTADMRPRPNSEAFSLYASNRHSQARLASTAATNSDRDSQPGKEYDHEGVVTFQAAAPSQQAYAHTLRTCSPAPSAMAGRSSLSVAEVFTAASRNQSPAIAQGPFTPPPEGQADQSAVYGTLTNEPEALSRSATDSLHEAHAPSKGGAFKKLSAAFHRGSTRSSGSESRGTDNRSLDIDLDPLDQAQTAHAVPYLRNDKPPEGGAAAEYYAGGPLSPPEELLPFPGPGSEFISLIGLSGASFAGPALPHTQQPSSHLRSPFTAAGAPPSPVSPLVEGEDLSSDEGEGKRSLEATGNALSTPPRGLPFEPSPKKFEPSPGPSQPAPGTLNPMDVMKPSTDAEQAAWVDTELWKMENSPPPPMALSPPQSEASPPPQQELYQPFQPEEYIPSQYDPPQEPGRPRFQAVVRQPTQMDVTSNGQGVPQAEEQIVTDISDTSSPGYDQYAYGPSPSNHTSPETRLTASPSPRSSMSGRPSSSYDPASEYLVTTPGDQSQGSMQGDASTSPKPTSFACDICGSKFDQVHKLNHHKRYHERPHQCSQCEKRFGTKTHLDRHINDKHNKTRKYHCTVVGCAYSKQGGGKSFPRKDNWRRHMQNKHQQVNPPEPVEEDVIMGE